MRLPSSYARIVQLPAPLMCTSAGETGELSVQWPARISKPTSIPDVAVATMVKSASPNVLSSTAPKSIVWSAFAIAKLCVTSGAAL